ncbi:MAG: decarboxylating 6-phosphogluconate dehydrogenase [Candidatus Omnitrophica bacterium]|nr:decarboxylating 6-phosphogluconate dehydrogenase [Candidatus Omnitrophota bacterium]
MKIGFVGLGKMGANMVERLLRHGHQVTAYDLSEQARNEISKKGAEAAVSLSELVKKLVPSRIVWVMVPAGKPTEETINSLDSLLGKGDIVIDGGNSYYKDSIRRYDGLKKKDISFLDAGTSGGIWGLKIGYCLMVGGEEEAFKKAEPVFKALAPDDGYAHVGKSGAGHFVKMVHNGIEYAMLQAYGEGFEVMEAKKEFNLDLARISQLWNHGSVVRSWILELAEDAFKKSPHLEGIEGFVADSGEGRWTVVEAISEDVPAPIITLSLLERFRSRQKESFSAKTIAALRNEFGGHAVKKK